MSIGPLDLPELQFAERAALEIDTRLHELLVDALGLERWTSEAVAAFLRLAYATGYQAALQETGRGQLYRDLQLPIPEREAQRTPQIGRKVAEATVTPHPATDN
jgi:hypothetical protein